MESSSISSTNLIDGWPIRSLQWRVFFICGLVAIFDGFNAQVLAIVAPTLVSQWKLGTSTITMLFAVGLAGTAVGSCTLGWIADRIGRKPVLSAALLLLGVATLACVTASTPTELAIYRFLGGLGLGAAVPNIITLTVDYSPERHRNVIVNAMMCGFPLGAAAGGAIVGHLLPEYGWKSAFVLGGVAPLAVLPILLIGLPESLRFLASRESTAARLRGVCRMLKVPDDVPLPISPRLEAHAPLLDIFDQRYRFGTIGLVIMSIGANIVQYFLISWSPWLLHATGMSATAAVYGAVSLGIGSALGAILIGRVMDRFGSYRILCVSYVLCVLTIGGISIAIDESRLAVLSAIFVAGIFVTGSRFGVNAAATGFYPTQVRATGVSTCYGFSQIGSVLGPLVGGMLIAMPLNYQSVFRCAAIPAAVNALVGWMLYRRIRETGGQRTAVAPVASSDY
ncbi:MFS transporter [Paraburkholderia caribensis]|uniref:MFS transporter n=1 Tax=Paraburkholderia caribensis TaxID=75105 RepID=UPI001CB1A9B8|nr:MFS transporter [Paraburkholderia caribensis]CAG9263108.1 4-hydroxybenzoate transporter [Paraburkholderia caribensis]